MKELTEEERKMIRLLPCPFCGGYPKQMSGMGEFWVMCDICQASIGMSNTEFEAIEEWNRRWESADDRFI